MDSEAVVPGRDRSPAAAEAQSEERSRSVVSGAATGPGGGASSGSAPASDAAPPAAAPASAAASAAGWWAQWRPTVLLAAGCVAALLLVSHFVVEPFQVPSTSMEGTLRVGDRVLVDKLAYRFGGTPQRGDVIVFDGDGSFQQTGGTDYVKRVIGVGGDRVTCCDDRGRITVNGRALDEAYLHPGDAPSRVPFDIEVPVGRLWVMGDHRDDSRDSRDHLGDPGGGTVPVGRVIGRAEWIGWPAGHWTKLRRPAAFAAVTAPPAGRRG
ncbi:signal peptidase I [Actinacidiphila sp. ITFR-21]|uniref:signal peptidase I n=1 Tax=Actinacidiphila sp. ITFR-21 TaxID=3075199 RepID=UPI00288A0699|nr:signal peptidase I [Streptomyces sp. ITFR-21]WNI18299.1 signal peptidase I [Streptomyces sp. ITFR-21]